MGWPLIGRRAGLGTLAGLGRLGLEPGQPVDELGDLARELQQDAVLLFDMPLQEGDAFLEVAKAGIHAPKMRGGGDRASRCLAYD